MMFKGYYTLTSSMLTQNNNLNVLSNNMVNVSTPGYKRDVLMPTTFQEEVLSRYDNMDPPKPVPVGEVSMINVPGEMITDHSMGGFEDTGGIFDFALNKEGFFQIQTQDGTMYTRDGAFIVDDERYLALPKRGRVLGENGPIKLDSDTFSVDSMGNIYNGAELLDKIAVVNFADNNQLRKAGEGMFESNETGTPVEDAVMWKTLENSNVNMVSEMTAMMTTQRSIQSSAQILKIYDQMMNKAANDIGRV